MKVAELENISQHVVQLTREVEDAKKRELEHRNAINKEQASETAEMIN